MLTFFANYDRQAYDTLSYEIVEISSVMADICRARLAVNHKKLLDNHQIRIVQDDIANFKVSFHPFFQCRLPSRRSCTS